ncbi:unnamed protein product [Cylindrotheca closterium]|uniref:Glycosyl transferase CAP10 domain-containing protein n=1 Tax=Cylindrotheca closterium TaxID=2856 RepID=A0AAD2CES5_9STRA|nr:unnamed protein product [Cylindrotheca closterium]
MEDLLDADPVNRDSQATSKTSELFKKSLGLVVVLCFAVSFKSGQSQRVLDAVNHAEIKSTNQIRLETRRYQLGNLTKRPHIGIIEVHPNGNFSIINSPEKGFVHHEFLDCLKTRLRSAVEAYGEFQEGRSSLFFDFDAVDFPATEGYYKHLSCDYLNKVACCYTNLTMIGIANNPCCNCSLPLPIHPNQREEDLDNALAFQDPFNWTRKMDKAVWHGAPHGHHEHAAWLSQEYHLPVPYKPGVETPRRRIVQWATRSEAQGLLDASFSKIEWKEILKYKYLVTVSGNSYAGALKPALLSNSCVLRQDTIAREWFEDELEEWVHFVPVKYDLSDLFEKIEWAKEHDSECEAIAKNGRTFALKHFEKGAVDKFLHSAIQKTKK